MKNRFSLKNRTIVITGPTGYLGLEMAKGLNDFGAKLILISRSKDKLISLNKQLGPQHIVVAGDISSSDFSSNLPSELSRLGVTKIDGIINNAYSGETGTISVSSEIDFINSFNLNLKGPFSLIKALLPFLSKSEHDIKTIVNIASMYGKRSPNHHIYDDEKSCNPIQYGATKAGLIQMTKYLGAYLAEQNIRVNSISPGPFPNQSNCDKDFLNRLKERVPLQRLGSPEDLVGTVIFLSSQSCSYITGADFPVDGGWTVW